MPAMFLIGIDVGGTFTDVTASNIPALFVPTFVRPKPVVGRKSRFEVTERLNADGSVLVPLDMASVDRVLDAALAMGAEAVAVCLLHADAGTAARLAVGTDAVVELVNPAGAPLRAWVASVAPGDGRVAEVPPVALRMLALAEGALVEIRAVHSGTLGGPADR
jgi:hypothetical protein